MRDVYVQLILLKSSGPGIASPSKDGTVQWHWCIMQPMLPSLRVLQHSWGVTYIHHLKEEGWLGNVSFVNLPIF